jgi:head-tail adaptor
MSRAGNMWHRIKFYPKVISRDDYNASVDSWPTATIETRGEIRYTGGSRILSNEEKFYSRTMILTIRYREGIVETMRVQIDGGNDWYLISSPIEEIGRKEGLMMTLEKINI